MGIDVVRDSDFRYKCTRKSRKQVIALTSSYNSSHGTPNMSSLSSPSPSSTFRSFFGRKNSSSPQTSLLTQSPSMSMPSPALSLSASTMEGTQESVGLSPSMSTQSIMHPMPYYGSNTSTDTGGEVRFTIEVVRVKGLKGLYTLDLRRLKGSLPDYKENHVSA